MARNLIGAAIILGAVSVLLPAALLLIVSITLAVLGQSQNLLLFSLVGIVPLTWLYYRRLSSQLFKEKIKVNKKQDWERLGIALSLVFTMLATLLSIQNFFGQNITISSCYKPSDKINVTSPNCNMIQTASVPQSLILGPQGVLILDIVLLGLAAFGVWLFILYAFEKVEK